MLIRTFFTDWVGLPFLGEVETAVRLDIKPLFGDLA